MTKNVLEQKNGAGASDSDLPVRQFFRIPASPDFSIQVIVNGRRYSGVDISLMGVGIRAKEPPEYEPGQILEGIELEITGASFRGLSGRIIHDSPADAGNLTFGIQWTNLGDEDLKTLADILSRVKRGLLQKYDRDVKPDEEEQK